MLIGLCGPPCSGKRAVAEYLRDHCGFTIITLESLLDAAVSNIIQSKQTSLPKSTTKNDSIDTVPEIVRVGGTPVKVSCPLAELSIPSDNDHANGDLYDEDTSRKAHKDIPFVEIADSWTMDTSFDDPDFSYLFSSLDTPRNATTPTTDQSPLRSSISKFHRDGVDPCMERKLLTESIIHRHGEQRVLAVLADEYYMEHWTENYVVYDLRYTEEVQLLKKRPLFLLVVIDAPIKFRYNNYLRYKESIGTATASSSSLPAIMDLLTFIERDDIIQYGVMPSVDIGGAVARSQVREVASMADVFICNVTTSSDALNELLRKFDLGNKNRIRPNWDTYFMRLADLAASRSNCMKRKVGAVLSKNNRVVATGYNGTPRGCLNCNEGGCRRCNTGARCGENLDSCLCLHAEENSIIEAGHSRGQGCSLYVNTFPCLGCAKKIVQVGVVEVIYLSAYSPESEKLSLQLFSGAGVVVRQHSPDSLASDVKKIY